MPTLDRRANRLANRIDFAIYLAGEKPNDETAICALGITLARILKRYPAEDRGQIADALFYQLPDFVRKLEATE